MEKLLNIDNINLKNVYSLLTEKLINWYEILIKSIPNLLVAIAVFILFIFLAKLAKSTAEKLLPRMTSNKAVINLFKTITYFIVLLIGLFVTLEILNLNKTVSSILAGAGVIGLALGFAFQEIASNFVSGIFIAFRKPYQIGDIVKVEDYFGKIHGIDLRTTRIRTFDELEILIPNKYMFTKPLINYTTTSFRRLDLNVGVSYGDDLEKVQEVTLKALQDVDHRDKDKEIEFFYEEFGGSSINFVVRIWIHYPENKAYLKVKHQAIINISKAFADNSITIPFPIRTLDFGIKGGKELMESLPKHQEPNDSEDAVQ